jgi:hypothetical protein
MPTSRDLARHVPIAPLALGRTARQLLIPKEVFFMEPANELVYIVDDEANVGEALSTLLRANGKRV